MIRPKQDMPRAEMFISLTRSSGMGLSMSCGCLDLCRTWSTTGSTLVRRGISVFRITVEQPTKFYISVNLKTAKSIGLSIHEMCSPAPTR